MESGAFCLIIFRIVQAVVAIVVLSTALFYVLKTQWITNSGNFMVFNACWTLVVLCYLAVAPVWLSSRGNVAAMLFFEIVTLIFWFSGWIALAVDIPSRHCVWGFNCWSTRALNSGRTAIAFGALEWLLFCFTTVLLLHLASKRRRRDAETVYAQSQAPRGKDTHGHPSISTPQPVHPGTDVTGQREPYRTAV